MFLTLGNLPISIIRLDKTGSLETKIRIERDEPDTKFLVYSPSEEPDYEDDWLLDIRLYSRSFRADRASIILDELKLSQQHLRQHIAARRKFFDSKERLQKLKPLVIPDDTAEDLDRKMISVVVRSDQTEWFSIILTLFHSFTDENNEIDLDIPPEFWKTIVKYDLSATFWEFIEQLFGYSEKNPSLKNFLIRLMVTDFSHHLKSDLPGSLANLELSGTGRSNAVVFLAQWRDSSSKSISYDKLSMDIEDIIRLEDYLYTLKIKPLIDVMTFRVIEKKIASDLKNFVIDHMDIPDSDLVRSIATHRQAGHWASLSSVTEPEIKRKALHEVYNALVSASEFYKLQTLYIKGFTFENSTEMYGCYTDNLYRFDQLYRCFCEAADQVQNEGWSILKDLRENIEKTYIQGYLIPLSYSWDSFINTSKPDSLLKSWKIKGISNQYQFYNSAVKPKLAEAGNRRVFVIISDALRYEAAHELTDILNGKYRYEAELKSQLGVLPSYTSLGMASLLPHKSLTFKDNGDVLVDGARTSSFEQRKDILAQSKGTCIRSKDLLAMRQNEGRKLVANKKVVYIYHDTIDSTGDSASSESRTFHGVRTALEELTAIVTYCINNLNGTYVVVTADHGFLFSETSPGEPEKSRLNTKPENAFKSKKRYVLGRNLDTHESVWKGNVSVTAGMDSDVEFWIPHSVNLFHFTGGARFIHGGAALQEIVVPIIIVRQLKGRAKQDTRTKSVPVSILGSSHRITTNQHRFELIQMEPVSERIKAVTIKIAVYEGDDPVTNIEKVPFTSDSDKIDERKKWVSLVLKKRDYQKNTPYRLILRDAETGIEIQSMPVIIDRAFSNDF